MDRTCRAETQRNAALTLISRFLKIGKKIGGRVQQWFSSQSLSLVRSMLLSLSPPWGFVHSRTTQLKCLDLWAWDVRFVDILIWATTDFPEEAETTSTVTWSAHW